MSQSNVLISRAQQLIRIANFVLNALFWFCLLFLLGGGLLLALAALSVHPILSVVVVVAAGVAAYVLREKKKKVSDLLNIAGGVVDSESKGQRARQRIVDVLKSLVEEALGAAAMSFAIVPGVIAVLGVIIAFLKYKMVALVLFGIAVVSTACAACLYYVVRFFALREIDHVVVGLLGEDKKGDKADGEREPLIKR